MICWVWFTGGRRADIGAQMALAVIFIILIAPVTSFYDVGLAVIPVIVLFAAHGRVSASLVAFLWLTSHLHLLSPVAGINLLLIPLAVLLVVALRYLWVPATRAAPPLARLRAD